MSDATTIAAGTMTGDLRDRILERLKDWAEKPWSKRAAADQRIIAQQVDAMVRDSVREMVELIAAKGATPVRGQLMKIATAKGMLQLQVDVARTEDGRHDLIDGVGSTILLITADALQYFGERNPPDIQPDQPELLTAAE
jgi:hypothetical protein